MSKDRIKIIAWIREHVLRPEGWDPPVSDYWLGSYDSGNRPKVLSQAERNEVALEILWRLKSFVRAHRSDHGFSESYSALEKELLRKAASYGIDEEMYYDILLELIESGRLTAMKEKQC